MMVERKIDIFMPISAVFFQCEIAAEFPVELFLAESDMASILRADRITIGHGVIEQVTCPAGSESALRRDRPVIADPGRHLRQARYALAPIAEGPCLLTIKFEQRDNARNVEHAGALDVIFLRDKTLLLLKQ